MGKTIPAGRLIWLDTVGGTEAIPDTLRESVKRNWNRFVGYAARKLKDRDEAEDVIRDVVRATVTTRREAIAHPDAYLFKAVLREVRKRLRASRELTYVGSLGELESIKDAIDFDWVSNLDDHLFVQEFVSAMDDEAREVYFRWAKKDSWEEIAEDLGCSVQCAKDRLRHGIQRAKRRLFAPCVGKR